MTGGAEGLPVLRIIEQHAIAAMRHDVIDVRARGRASFIRTETEHWRAATRAHAAQRVLAQERGTPRVPAPRIATRVAVRPSVVERLLRTQHDRSRMLGTVATPDPCGTTGRRTGPLWG